MNSNLKTNILFLSLTTILVSFQVKAQVAPPDKFIGVYNYVKVGQAYQSAIFNWVLDEKASEPSLAMSYRWEEALRLFPSLSTRLSSTYKPKEDTYVVSQKAKFLHAFLNSKEHLENRDVEFIISTFDASRHYGRFGLVDWFLEFQDSEKRELLTDFGSWLYKNNLGTSLGEGNVDIVKTVDNLGIVLEKGVSEDIVYLRNKLAEQNNDDSSSIQLEKMQKILEEQAALSLHQYSLINKYWSLFNKNNDETVKVLGVFERTKPENKYSDKEQILRKLNTTIEGIVDDAKGRNLSYQKTEKALQLYFKSKDSGVAIPEEDANFLVKELLKRRYKISASGNSCELIFPK
ncbi:MAG: hypothetical protein ACXVCP_20120 [Bdellovibrio sp.]